MFSASVRPPAPPTEHYRTTNGSQQRSGRAMEVTREQVKDFLKNMSLMEASNLVKERESELGVSAAAPMAIAAAGPAGGGAAAAAPEKEDFTVVLTGSGDK